jgi:signal transduction histidine kinase
MKNRIIIVLGIYAVVFLLAGLYIIKTIRDATSTLDQLITLHQVEILREHFLIQLKRVQTDLVLKDTRHSRDFNTFVNHARNMGSVVDTCFNCHHGGPVADQLQELKRETEVYKEHLSRVLTLRANAERLAEEENAAFHVGEGLIARVTEMVATTGARLEANTQKALREIDDTKYILYTLVIFGPLVSVALGWVLVSGLTGPVRTLVASTRKLKAGDLDHRVAGLRHEFGELGGAFNEMAKSLKEHMQNMQRAEQLAAVGELAAGLAHEIKNPLAGIKVAMRVLEDEDRLSPEDGEVVRKVGEEVERLEALMKSFLNFAKPPKPQLTDVNVNAVMDATIAFYAGKPHATPESLNGIKIVKDFGDLPSTMADPIQLQQVFVNLVINATDAMSEGGTLSVRTSLEDDDSVIKVEIADTGRGIDAEHVESIFEPFFTTKHGGTGLGLATSRQLIQQHGGSIRVTGNEGGGTVFTVRLPLRPVDRRIET